MTLPRSLLLGFCFTVLCAGFFAAASQSAAQAAPQPAATSQSAPANPQNAYTLPPDKLAKAIAVNRIRSIMDIVAGIWGFAVIWLLLATRAAAALGAWAERVFTRRWMQGLLFFAALIVILTVASLPLDMFGHHVSVSYGISVQGWAQLAGRPGQEAWRCAVSASGSLVLLLFNWMVRKWPSAATGFGLVAGHDSPDCSRAVMLSPLLIEPLFDTSLSPSCKTHAAAGGQA
jgi:STE24 endopeptidase